MEPLNRYESDIVNNAEEGLALVEEVGHKSLGVLLDTFHMNIEEALYDTAIRSVARAGLRPTSDLADTAWRPAGGHLDFTTILASLRAVDYRGDCRLSCWHTPTGM